MKCEFNGEVNIITSSKNGKSYNAGNFKLMTVSDFPNLPVKGNGKFHIIHVNGIESTNYSLIDSLSSQSLPENDGATFLAASNFNCLEYVGVKSRASDGVTNYMFDFTQGPYLALAAGPAIVFRNYFYEVSPGIFGQLETEINLLHQTPLHVTRGYPIIKKEDLPQLREYKDFSNPNNYLVGVHSNCQVTEKRGADGLAQFNGNQITHQVFSSCF